MAEANLSGQSGMSSFNGRRGVVTPQNGDYTPEMIGAETEFVSRTVILSTSWGSSSPYEQAITISNLNNSDIVHVIPVYSSDAETALLEKQAWNKVFKAKATADTLTFYCFEEIPDRELTLRVVVNNPSVKIPDTTAFAVYSAGDLSLTFYNRATIPAVNSTYNGKVVTRVYTGFDNVEYAAVGNVPWVSHKSTLKSVSFEDVISPVSTAYWFSQCYVLTSCNVEKLDTSRTTNMRFMFDACNLLTGLDVSGFDTRKVTDMYAMFNACKDLTDLDVCGFNTSKVANMRNMFAYCELLTSLDLSKFDTSKVNDMSYMFAESTSLETIYVSNKWSTESIVSSVSMFERCSALVGGNGTTYNSSNVDHTYARIDASGTPGYLTYKEAM